jgi:hypothetical protein
MSEEKFKLGGKETIAIVVGVLLIIMFIYNGVRISGISGISTGGAIITPVSASEILPSGIPKIYGKELGVNFDEVSESNPQGANANIAILSNLDKTITLQGADLERYIKIVIKISCEFCCGAQSIIRSDGSSACGCAHSYAMRGLAKYLITEHGTEYTDDEILSELGKWKVLFFPGIHESKAEIMRSQGIEVNYISLASNENRGIEKGAPAGGGGMVGGC